MKQPIIVLLLLSFFSITIHAANDKEYRPMTPKRSNAMLVRRERSTDEEHRPMTPIKRNTMLMKRNPNPKSLPKPQSIESSTGGESDSPLIGIIPIESDSDTEEPEIQPVDSDNDEKSPSPVVKQKPNFIGWMQQRAQEDEQLEESFKKNLNKSFTATDTSINPNLFDRQDQDIEEQQEVVNKFMIFFNTQRISNPSATLNQRNEGTWNKLQINMLTKQVITLSDKKSLHDFIIIEVQNNKAIVPLADVFTTPGYFAAVVKKAMGQFKNQ